MSPFRLLAQQAGRRLGALQQRRSSSSPLYLHPTAQPPFSTVPPACLPAPSTSRLPNPLIARALASLPSAVGPLGPLAAASCPPAPPTGRAAPTEHRVWRNFMSEPSSRTAQVPRPFPAAAATACSILPFAYRGMAISQSPPEGPGAQPSSPKITLKAPAAAAGQPHGPPTWADVPPHCKFLGLTGIVPFIALCPPIAATIPFLPMEIVTNAAQLQTSYGVSIATFLGGVHWGMAMAEYGGKALSAKASAERYMWSVTPSLVAFPVVVLPPLASSLILTATLTAALLVDRSFTSKGLLPKWYMALRFPLHIGATSGLMMTAYYYTYLIS